jgi:hypothetical protein
MARKGCHNRGSRLQSPSNNPQDNILLGFEPKETVRPLPKGPTGMWTVPGLPSRSAHSWSHPEGKADMSQRTVGGGRTVLEKLPPSARWSARRCWTARG